MVLGGTATLGLWQALIAHEHEGIRRSAEQVAVTMAEDLSNSLESDLLAIERMAARAAVAAPMPQALWRADAEAYLSHIPALRAIALADPHGRRRLHAGVATASDLVDLTHREALRRTASVGAMVSEILAGDATPRYVRVTAPVGAKAAHGFLDGLLDLRRVVTRIQDGAAGVRVEVSTPSGAVITGPASSPDAAPSRWHATSRAAIRGLPLAVSVWPKVEAGSTAISPLPIVVLLAGLALSALAAVAIRLLAATQAARNALHDLTGDLQRRVAERTLALERSNEKLEQFAYVASHDLQEPLRKVVAFTGLLSRQLGDGAGDDARHSMDRMVDATGRMRQLIDDLLAYSRIETGGRAMAPVGLGVILDGVLGDLEASITEAEAEVIVGPLATVEGDARQLRQLLQNLVSNALKYRREGVPARVEIAAEPASVDAVVLRVADNGIGFDMRFSERIFAPFQRLHGRGAYSGTGIGLAICKRIVERHGGTICGESAPGVGSTFLVTLPVRQPAQGVAAAT